MSALPCGEHDELTTRGSHMKRRGTLIALVAVAFAGGSLWLAWDWIEPGFRWFFPHSEKYQLVAVSSWAPVVVRINTRTGSLAIYLVVPESGASGLPEFKAVRVGYEPGPYSP